MSGSFLPWFKLTSPTWIFTASLGSCWRHEDDSWTTRLMAADSQSLKKQQPNSGHLSSPGQTCASERCWTRWWPAPYRWHPAGLASPKKNGFFPPGKGDPPELGIPIMAASGSMVEIWGCNYIVFFRWFIWIPPHLTLGIPTKRGSTVPRHIEISVLSTTHVGIYWKLTTQYAASFETPSRESVVRVWIQIESWISSLGSFCLVLMKFLTPLFRLNMIEHHTVERPFELMAPKFTAKVAAFKQ